MNDVGNEAYINKAFIDWNSHLSWVYWHPISILSIINGFEF